MSSTMQPCLSGLASLLLLVPENYSNISSQPSLRSRSRHDVDLPLGDKKGEERGGGEFHTDAMTVSKSAMVNGARWICRKHQLTSAETTVDIDLDLPFPQPDFRTLVSKVGWRDREQHSSTTRWMVCILWQASNISRKPPRFGDFKLDPNFEYRCSMTFLHKRRAGRWANDYEEYGVPSRSC